MTDLALQVQVRGHEVTRDYHVALADENVSVSEVLGALGLPDDAVIDGRLVAKPASIRAVDIFASGSRVDQAHALADRSVTPSAARSLVEVSVIGGLDAGRAVELDSGLYRIGAAPGAEGSGWFVQVDERAPASREGPLPRRPWHENGSTVEAVLVDGSVVSLGKPIALEPGYGMAVHRPPRQLSAESVPVIECHAAPQAVAEPSPLSWSALLAPIPIALMMAIFFRPIFALFAAMGPVMAVGRWYESRRRHRRDTAARAQLVGSMQQQLEAQASVQAEELAAARWQAHPHIAELWRRARTGSVRLWERRPGAAGYLNVAIGIGPDRVGIQTSGPISEVHPSLPKQLVLRAVPHVVDLQANTGLGVHGTRERSLAVARAALLQLATSHGPADLKVGVLCDQAATGDWDWLKWLPHTDPALVSMRSAPITKHFADRPVDSSSTSSFRSTGAAVPEGPVDLIVVDDVTADVAAIHRVSLAAARPTRFIVVAPTATGLPAVCSSLIEVGAAVAEIASPELGGSRSVVCPIGVSAATATGWARALTAFVDPELTDFAPTPESGLSLLHLLRFKSADELGQQWEQRSLSAPAQTVIGVSDDGPFVIDLAQDGPHVLVAGTTGSGKSELLRTLIVGLAVGCPPEHLNFVLIDFKGGGAFDAIDRLPHVAGLITDLDESMVERAITSLRSELQRRELLFRDLGVSDFGQASRQSIEPLARLVVVIDEFAALATDYGELMTAIVDLAARGRSLGIHLVLATQRPSGVIDQKIRANTNLRIALRVQDAFDSLDVVGTGDAAAIDRKAPGRAIFSVGGDAPVAVQTAWSGVVDNRSDRCAVGPLALFPTAQVPAVLFPEKSEAAREVNSARPSRTELDVLVDAITHVSMQRESRARPLWVDPLPDSLDWIELGTRELGVLNATGPDQIAIGLEDVPELQAQRPWRWSPSSGPLALYSASAACAGKALLSVGAALASADALNPAHLYIIDGDAGQVSGLRDLASTGAYITLDESDRVERVIRFFESKLAKRRAATDQVDRHRLVLIVDNIAAVFASFNDNKAAELVDRLSALARDGAPQGLHLVIAARTVRDIGHRLSQQFPHRLVLALADMTGYLTLGLTARQVPLLPAMRAIDLSTRRLVQIVEPPDLTTWTNPAASGVGLQPEPIGDFPQVVAASELALPTLRHGVLQIPVGTEGVELEQAILPLRAGEHALVVAQGGLGRSTTACLIVEQLASSNLDFDIVRVGPTSSPLRGAHLGGRLVEDPIGLVELGENALRQVVVVVDDADRLDAGLTQALSELLAANPDHVRVIATTTPNHARSIRSWLTKIRGGGTGVLITGSPNDADLFGARVERIAGLGRLPGRGYLLVRGQAWPTQFACVDLDPNAPSPNL